MRAQTNIRARYAKGQVWVAWTETGDAPETYAIYRGATPFTNVGDAQLAGRLFRFEWHPVPESTQTTGLVNRWLVPRPTNGYDTLATNDGLFVDTVVDPAPRYYAVVKWGDSLAVPGVNRSSKVSVAYSLADAPQCHLLGEYVQNGQWLVSLYAMWADGRDDESTGRPDFPVTANHHKNGMPSMLFLSRPLALPPGLRPLVHWFHGGDGEARQSLPGDRPTVDIDPDDGFLCAENDDLVRKVPGFGLEETHSNSWFFGWARGMDPFDSSYVTPAPTDTVVNYTQRRLAWINDWLIAHYPIDPHRVALQGHSVGSAGVTAFGKAYPHLFSTVTVFENGFMGPDTLDYFGARSVDLPTSILLADGSAAHIFEAFDLKTSLSPERDLPLFRVFSGKHDTDGTMMWDADVVAEFRAADSLALGTHVYWDERAHALGAIPSYFMHGTTPATQIERDNVVYQGRYRSDQSYPAFFNHRLYPDSHDPGDGTPGTSTADPVWSGDDWGTWGGFHDWDPDSIVDTPGEWSSRIWLIGSSAWLPDNCPYDSLTCDVAIRRPQAFRPGPATPVYWYVTDTSGWFVQHGLATVRADSLVSAAGVVTAREPAVRRLHFSITAPAGVVRDGIHETFLELGPTPVHEACHVRFALAHAGRARLRTFDVAGRQVAVLFDGPADAGIRSLTWRPAQLPPGVYLLRLEADGIARTRRLVHIR